MEGGREGEEWRLKHHTLLWSKEGGREAERSHLTVEGGRDLIVEGWEKGGMLKCKALLRRVFNRKEPPENYYFSL